VVVPSKWIPQSHVQSFSLLLLRSVSWHCTAYVQGGRLSIHCTITISIHLAPYRTFEIMQFNVACMFVHPVWIRLLLATQQRSRDRRRKVFGCICCTTRTQRRLPHSRVKAVSSRRTAVQQRLQQVCQSCSRMLSKHVLRVTMETRYSHVHTAFGYHYNAPPHKMS